MGTRLGCFCDRLIEAGWLLAAAVVPVFFNLHTSRVFDPDKGYLLCGLAFVMTAAWLIKTIEHVIYRLGDRPGWSEWKRANHLPRPRLFYVLVVLSMLFAAVHIASTLISVHPRTSLMGSYQRGQGTILTLCLIAISMLIATHLRTRGQLYRLLAAIALGSLLVAFYTVIEGVGLTPQPWNSLGYSFMLMMGSPGSVAAYLVMTIPITLAGLVILVTITWNELQRVKGATPAQSPAWYTISSSRLVICGIIVLGLQVTALILTDARIALLALLATTVPSVLLVVVPICRTRIRWVPLGLADVLIFYLLLTMVISSFTNVSLVGWSALQRVGLGSTPVIRQLIREGAWELLYTHPVAGGQPDRWQRLRPFLGYGPETMHFTYNQVFQPELGHYISRAAPPNRAYNQLLDVGVNLGWIGTTAFLLLLSAFFWTGLSTISTAQGILESIVVSGILWACLIHLVETQFNSAIISTQLLFWVGLGIVAALTSHYGAALVEEEPTIHPSISSLTSGVALLILPTTALVAVAMSGFSYLRASTEVVIVTLSGAALALLATTLSAAAVVVVRRRKSEERYHYSQWLHPTATGLLSMLMLLLLVVAVLAFRQLIHYDSNSSDLLAILQIVKTSAILTWGAVLLGLLGVAFSLPYPRPSSTAQDRRGPAVLLVVLPVYILILAGTVALILNICVRPVQADIIYKQADPYDHSGKWAEAAEHYRNAVELAPYEDFYCLYLGRALLEQARGEKDDDDRRKELLTQTQEALERAQALSPLNPDHTANLARFHRVMRGLDTDLALWRTHVHTADRYYADTMILAPYNVALWNEWASLRYYNLDDEAGFQQCVDYSLALDPEYERTWQLVGDVQAFKGNPEKAAEAYRRALDIQPHLPELWRDLGRIYLWMEQSQKAIEALSQALELHPDSNIAVSVHWLLAEAYQQMGDLERSQEEVRIALEMTPAGQQP